MLQFCFQLYCDNVYELDLTFSSIKLKNNARKKQKKQSKLKIQKTRLSQEIRRYKWQDNMNLYENQRWNHVICFSSRFQGVIWNFSKIKICPKPAQGHTYCFRNYMSQFLSRDKFILVSFCFVPNVGGLCGTKCTFIKICLPAALGHHIILFVSYSIISQTHRCLFTLPSFVCKHISVMGNYS